MPDRAHEALAALSEKAYSLLFIWTHIPSDARTSLSFNRKDYTTLDSVLAAFATSKNRTQLELMALKEELAKSIRWTKGKIEFPFLICLAEGRSAVLTQLSDVLACRAVWLSCEADDEGTRAGCRDVPEGEEMMACGRVSHALFVDTSTTSADSLTVFALRSWLFVVRNGPLLLQRYVTARGDRERITS